MSWLAFILMLAGGFICAASLCTVAAFAIYWLLGDSDDT